MSTIYTEIVEIDQITAHPNADMLEVAHVKGAQVCVGKGSFQPGTKAVYFPPDMIVPDQVADALGVRKYLKSGGRVAACRLRGQPSYGFLAPLHTLPPGANVDAAYGASKFVPVPKVLAADAEADHPAFHQYTNIEHWWRFPDAIAVGTPVRITEKKHGSNLRAALIDGEFMAGSHRIRRKPGSSIYWQWYYVDSPLFLLLQQLAIGAKAVIAFGEIYGPGIQDMDYGLEKPTYAVFDISVDGRYLDWEAVQRYCEIYNVPTVPLLYSGPFSRDLIEQYTHGPAVAHGRIRSKFKGREGIVITPLVEQHSDALGGRLILKSVSADYLDRKEAQDNE